MSSESELIFMVVNRNQPMHTTIWDILPVLSTIDHNKYIIVNLQAT